MKITVIIILSFLISFTGALAQENSPFSVSGYAEMYYIFDFNKPVNNTRPEFIYSHNRHNEVNINLGLIKGSYITNTTRANLALMTGTYANANLAAEPGVLKNVYEANAGVKISSKKNLWIDAGIFSSHIGFESAIGKDCWTMTRSLVADNSPYYEAGAKISYTTDNGKWFLSGLILNGWQRIQRVDGNSLPSFGTQVKFKPSSSITLNSSTFIGTDKPDSARQMRYFHNFYSIVQLSPKLGATVGFDYGIEQKSSEASSYNPWYSPVLILKYSATDKIALVVRGEYYHDKSGVIITTGTPNGFKTTGVSFNIDYSITPNMLWRSEFRSLASEDNIFTKGDSLTKNNTFIGTSLAVSF